VKQLKTAQGGPNDGLIVKPANPTPAQAEEIETLLAKGWKFDEGGVLRDPKGNAIHGDYDLQGVYQHRPDGAATKVDTNDKVFQRNLNEKLDPKLKMVQHGANDNFETKDPEAMGRQPGINETFLVIEPSGATKIVEGAAGLQRYYDQHGFEWPYEDFTRK
jgi:hypothetical protein